MAAGPCISSLLRIQPGWSIPPLEWNVNSLLKKIELIRKVRAVFRKEPRDSGYKFLLLGLVYSIIKLKY